MPVGKGARAAAPTASSRRCPSRPPTPWSNTYAQTTADALPALYGCLERLGGVPQRLVVDNDASLVVRRGRARPRPVDELAALLGALSMGCVVLPPGAPQSKGSVERSNGYLETSFLPLRAFADLADLQAQSDAWTHDTAWRRHHRRLGARVCEALAVERAELAPLPEPAPITDRRLEVRVSRDGFVRVGGVDYSLSPGYAGRRVCVHLGLSELAVFCEARRVAIHARSYVPADVVRDPAHMAALAAAQQARRRLAGDDLELPAVDLARYDALVGAPL